MSFQRVITMNVSVLLQPLLWRWSLTMASTSMTAGWAAGRLSQLGRSGPVFSEWFLECVSRFGISYLINPSWGSTRAANYLMSVWWACLALFRAVTNEAFWNLLSYRLFHWILRPSPPTSNSANIAQLTFFPVCQSLCILLILYSVKSKWYFHINFHINVDCCHALLLG